MIRRRSGFTIVEVTVVITIIAILAAISIVMYTKVQADARDSDRASKARIISEALEKYYKKNGEYPSCSAMTQSGAQVSSNVLVGIDPTALLVPNSPAGVTNSITCTTLTPSGPDAFAYIGDGSASCNSGQACLTYSLQYKQEGTNTVTAVAGLYKANISTSTVPTLNAVLNGASQADLSWTAVSNAVSYRVQQATDTGFTANLIETTTAGTTASLTSLGGGTTYYFRVLAVASGSEGAWSNTANVTTAVSPPNSTPTMSATMVGTNAVGTLTAVTCPAGTVQYQIRFRSTATATMGSWSGWSTWATGLTRTEPALEGYQYGFEGQARCFNGSTGSAPTASSNIATTFRPIGTPTAPTYLTPASFQSNVFAVVNFSGACPSGTTRIDATFRSKDWTGANWGPYAWGYNDSWTNSTGSNKNVEYWGKFRCQTTYSTSPYTAETYRVTVVTP